MTFPLINKILKHGSNLYYHPDKGAAWFIIMLLMGFVTTVFVTIEAVNPTFFGDSNGDGRGITTALLTFFGGGSYILALAVSCISSFILNFVYMVIFLKYIQKNNIKELNDEKQIITSFKTGSKLSFFYAFGSGFLLPAYLTTLICIGFVLSPIVSFSYSLDKGMDRVLTKLLDKQES